MVPVVVRRCRRGSGRRCIDTVTVVGAVHTKASGGRIHLSTVVGRRQGRVHPHKRSVRLEGWNRLEVIVRGTGRRWGQGTGRDL